jgi:hypothetical protein
VIDREEEEQQARTKIAQQRYAAHTISEPTEREVLGACLMNADAVAVCAMLLLPSDFYLVKYQRIFRAIVKSYQATGLTDPMAVADVLHRDPGGLEEAGGHEELMHLLEGVIAWEGVAHHAKIVKEHSRRRRFKTLTENVYLRLEDLKSTTDEVIDYYTSSIEAGLTPTTKPWECFSLDDYLAQQTSPWAVHGLFRAMQVVLLGSFPSVGKSTIASGWIHATLTGTQWCGRRTRQGSVIALIGEGRKGFCLRLDAERKRSGTPIPSGEYLELVKFKTPLSSPEGQAHMRALVAEQVAKHGKNPALVVIDTLSSHWSADEDSQESIAPFMRCVSTIAEEFDCAVVICHHTTKARGMFVMPELQDFRGSGAMIGAADCVVGLHSTKGKEGVVLETLKTKDDEPSGPINLVREIVPLGVDGDGDPITGALLVKAQSAGAFDETAQELKEQREAQSEKLNQCLAAMHELGGKTSNKDAVFALMSGKTHSKRAAFARLMDLDEIHQAGTARGRSYHLTTHPDCRSVCVCKKEPKKGRGGAAQKAAPRPPHGARGGEGRTGAEGAEVA